METLSTHGYNVPKLGLGTWELRGITCEDAVTKALSSGYRHIDTAQIYGNEPEIGSVLSKSGVPRSELFLTTKVWMDNVASGALQKSVEQSLKNLGTDYVDLLLLHWPVQGIRLADQITALETVQDWGMARMIGVSNYPTTLLRKILDETDAQIVANQVEYHPYLSQKTVIDFAKAHNMFVTAYCPLARGLVRTDPLLLRLAAKYNKSAGQIALRWLIQQDNVVAIPKAANPLHIEDNINIFDFRLTAEEMEEIASLAHAEGRIVNPEWAPDWDKPDHKAKAA